MVKRLLLTVNYFFDVVPVKVEFSDGAGGYIPAEVVNTSETRLEVIVPEGAGSGPLRVTTNFGVVESVLNFRDERNVFLNYDEPGKTPTKLGEMESSSMMRIALTVTT